jgi:hypothetical protein
MTELASVGFMWDSVAFVLFLLVLCPTSTHTGVSSSFYYSGIEVAH